MCHVTSGWPLIPSLLDLLSPLGKEGRLSWPAALSAEPLQQSGKSRRLTPLSVSLLAFCFFVLFVGLPELSTDSSALRDGFQRRPSQASQQPFSKNPPLSDMAAQGVGRGVTRLHFSSGIKLLPVFAFRMSTFLSWPGLLSIFETFVSKILHFWVVSSFKCQERLALSWGGGGFLGCSA